MILGHQMSTSNIVQLKALLSLATFLSYPLSPFPQPPPPTPPISRQYSGFYVTI